MRKLAAILGASIALSALGREAHAHALAQRYDLPLPLGYFLLGAGVAVAASFMMVALFARPARQRSEAWQRGAHRAIPAPIVAVLQFLSVAMLALIVAAGLFGDQRTFKNIAPVAVWVIWWVGLGLLSAIAGNIWALLNPWSAIFACIETLARHWAKSLSLALHYPAWLGAWPGCALFLLFAWIELVAPGRDVPANVALGILLYSALTWTGMALFGRKLWLKNGEAFSIAFGLIARFAPVDIAHDRRWRVGFRPIAAALVPRAALSPSMTAFVLLMLGTVTVDGLMETPSWSDFADALLASPANPDIAPAAYATLQTVLLLGFPLVLASFYIAAVFPAGRLARAPLIDVTGKFVLCLVPIAIGYHLAHYFSLLAVAGQFVIPLASDPFGFGWDLFGTTLYRIEIGVVDAKFIWYLSLGAIVTGHMIAVWLGHVAARTLFGEGRLAQRSQYPMLALMIGYTSLSLWILAQPIVEAGVR